MRKYGQTRRRSKTTIRTKFRSNYIAVVRSIIAFYKSVQSSDQIILLLFDQSSLSTNSYKVQPTNIDILDQCFQNSRFATRFLHRKDVQQFQETLQDSSRGKMYNKIKICDKIPTQEICTNNLNLESLDRLRASFDSNQDQASQTSRINKTSVFIYIYN